MSAPSPERSIDQRSARDDQNRRLLGGYFTGFWAERVENVQHDSLFNLLGLSLPPRPEGRWVGSLQGLRPLDFNYIMIPLSCGSTLLPGLY